MQIIVEIIQSIDKSTKSYISVDKWDYRERKFWVTTSPDISSQKVKDETEKKMYELGLLVPPRDKNYPLVERNISISYKIIVKNTQSQKKREEESPIENLKKRLIDVYDKLPKCNLEGTGYGWVSLSRFSDGLQKAKVSYPGKLKKNLEKIDIFEFYETLAPNKSIFIRDKTFRELEGQKQEKNSIANATESDNNEDISPNEVDNAPESSINCNTTDINHFIPEDTRAMFEALRSAKQEDWKTFSKPDYIGIWKSIIEKYPETAHFVYELIQNADDAQATETSIILYPDKLVFKHNGKRQFSITDINNQQEPMGDINSITSVACSTKKDEKQTIGKFGVGFKSVFQYTDTPSIYDDTFWFQIESYIIPKLLDSDHALRQKGETLIEIPFKNPRKAYSEILNRLNKLEMPVLFLPHVEKITWKKAGEDSIHIYSKTCRYTKQRQGITYSLYQVDDCERKHFLYLFKRDYNTFEGAHEICVGYFIDKGGNLITDIRPKIYCFFPTGETFDACFISHAPFLLTDNRDSIKSFEEINQDFLKGLAILAADALPCLRDIGLARNELLLEDEEKSIEHNNKSILLNDNLFSIINIKSNNERNNYLKDCFFKKINQSELLYSRSKKYIKSKYALVTTADLESLISANQIQALYQSDYFDFVFAKNNREEIRSLAPQIGIEAFDNKTLAARLTPDFMTAQEQEWCSKLISYIKEKARNLWVDTTYYFKRRVENNTYWKSDSWETLKFRFAPIAKTTLGDWISPYQLYVEEPNIMLPFAGISGVEEESLGKILDKDLYLKFSDFYNELGLRQPNMLDYFKKVIIPHYLEPGPYSSEMLRSDFRLIYEQLAKGANEDLVQLLKEKWKVCTRENDKYYVVNVEGLYIDDPDLRDFLSDTSNYSFLAAEYYEDEENGISIDDINAMMKKHFGLNTCPKIVESKTSNIYEMPSEVQDFLGDQSLSCSYSPDYYDYNIDGYDISKCTSRWSQLLWKFVCNSKSHVFYHECYESRLAYWLYRASNPKIKYYQSTLLRNLKNDKWISLGNGLFCSPSEITLNEFWELGYQKCEKWTSQLDFCNDEFLSITHKKEREAKEKEEAERSNLLDQAKELGIDINQLLLEGIQRVKNGDLPVNPSIPNSITNNIDSLLGITNIVGEDNLPYVAEHLGDFMDWYGGYVSSPSKVRSIIKYIGKKIYAKYLDDRKLLYEDVSDDGIDCDFCIEKSKYVRVLTTLKSITDYHIPVGLTAAQNLFLHKHPESQMRIIRISLTDISVLGEYNTIIGIHGKEDDPSSNKRLSDACERLAKNYWEGVEIEEFDAASPEFSIRIERKN